MGLQKYRADKPGQVCPNGAQPFYSEWMHGPSLALIRNCPIDGTEERRTVYIRAEPDTFFSQPAAARIKGKDIRGFITSDESGFLFTPNRFKPAEAA